MPIVSQQTVSVEIDSMKFSYDGSLEVIIRKSFSGADSATTMLFNLDKDVANTILDIPSMAGYTMRQSLVYMTYNYLIQNDLVVGEIQIG
jgi:hypothetical protein